MDIEQAFKVLGLSPNSSLDEISQAYHKKSLDLHPDVAGGDQKEQVELNQAHEMAEAYAKIRNAVIPISTNDLILRITRALSIPQYLETAETMGRRIAKKKTQSLQLVKQFSWIIGSISAFVAFFWKDLLPITSLDKVTPELDSALKIIAVMFGLMGLISQFIVKAIENSIEHFMERISDKKNCAEELAKTLGFRDLEFCTEDNFRGSIPVRASESPLSFFTFLRSQDLTQPLIAKAILHGLLQLQEQDEITPHSVQQYKVMFKPSLFKPEIKEKEERVPMTKKEALSMVIAGLVGLGLFGGGTYYLWFIKSSSWAFLPGFIMLITVMLFMAGIDELQFIRKKNLEVKPIGNIPKPPGPS